MKALLAHEFIDIAQLINLNSPTRVIPRRLVDYRIELLVAIGNADAYTYMYIYVYASSFSPYISIIPIGTLGTHSVYL